MDIFKLSSMIILFVFISFTVADEEIKTAVVDNENKLKLECEDDSTTHMLVTESLNFEAKCPNRSFWDNLGLMLSVYVHCQNKQNCSLDLTNITIKNCINYKNYINITYMCNITETTTTEEAGTTIMETIELELRTGTTTTESTTERPQTSPLRLMAPKYNPRLLPVLLTTKKPNINYIPNSWKPEPILQPPNPWFQGSSGYNNNYGGYNLPIIIPLPLPLPAPIPLFG